MPRPRTSSSPSVIPLAIAIMTYCPTSLLTAAFAPQSPSRILMTNVDFNSDFYPRNPTLRHQSSYTILHSATCRNHEDRQDERDHLSSLSNLECDTKRRKLFQSMRTSFVSSVLSSTFIFPSLEAQAKDDLFRTNPLTNPILEQMRIWDQDEADNIQYGGGLSSGSSKPKAFDQYVQLLQPILSIERDIYAVDQLLGKNNMNNDEGSYLSRLRQANQILVQPNFEKLNFKRIFNAFADNIYYSDPDRANLYLGGGAIPKSTQSLAYLLRNEVLTNVEDLRAELQYLIRESEKAGKMEELDLEDMYGFIKLAKEAMVKYLGLVPPRELEAARAKFTSV